MMNPLLELSEQLRSDETLFYLIYNQSDEEFTLFNRVTTANFNSLLTLVDQNRFNSLP